MLVTLFCYWRQFICDAFVIFYNNRKDLILKRVMTMMMSKTNTSTTSPCTTSPDSLLPRHGVFPAHGGHHLPVRRGIRVRLPLHPGVLQSHPNPLTLITFTFITFLALALILNVKTL